MCCGRLVRLSQRGESRLPPVNFFRPSAAPCPVCPPCSPTLLARPVAHPVAHPVLHTPWGPLWNVRGWGLCCLLLRLVSRPGEGCRALAAPSAASSGLDAEKQPWPPRCPAPPLRCTTRLPRSRSPRQKTFRTAQILSNLIQGVPAFSEG